MTTQSELIPDQLYRSIEGNSESIDEMHRRLNETNGWLDGVNKRLEGIEVVLIAIADHLEIDVNYSPKSKVIDLRSRRKRG